MPLNAVPDTRREVPSDGLLKKGVIEVPLDAVRDRSREVPLDGLRDQYKACSSTSIEQESVRSSSN